MQSNSEPQYRVLPIFDIEILENNPRFIKDGKFTKLVESIKADPNFLKQRPPLINHVDGRYICYAGNQRVRAAQAAGYIELVCFIEDDVSDEEQTKRMLLDNVHSGEWDFDILANEFDADLLLELGVPAWSTNFDTGAENLQLQGGEPDSDASMFEEERDRSVSESNNTGIGKAPVIKITFLSESQCHKAIEAIEVLLESKFKGAVLSV